MSRYLKGYIFSCLVLLAIFLIFSAEKLPAYDASSSFYVDEEMGEEKEAIASFYIVEVKKEGEVASFYIEEEKIKRRWQAKLGFFYGGVTLEEVNEFIGAIDAWYLTELKGMPWFEGVEWEKPPYFQLNLPRIENITGYYGDIVYMINPVWGMGIGYGEQRGNLSQLFEGNWESLVDEPGGEAVWVKVEGYVSMDVYLSGPSLFLILRKPELTRNLDAHFYLGVGSYTGTINWEIYEFWEEMMSDMPFSSSLPSWENNWQVSGQGNATGYETGVSFSYSFSQNLFMFLDAGYRSIVIENLKYREHIEKDSPDGAWLNGITKPSTLDFSGITGKFGIGLTFK